MVTARLVCIGDSFTEGMCDELRADGHYLGWADRVARSLAQVSASSGGQVEYANLAVRGKLLDQVVDEQVPVAVALAPSILTFHAGPNDVLRRGTDLADLQLDEPGLAWLWPAAERQGVIVVLDLGAVGSASYQTEAVASIVNRHPEQEAPAGWRSSWRTASPGSTATFGPSPNGTVHGWSISKRSMH